VPAAAGSITAAIAELAAAPAAQPAAGGNHVAGAIAAAPFPGVGEWSYAFDASANGHMYF